MTQEKRLSHLFRQADPGELVSFFQSSNQTELKQLAKRLRCEFTVDDPTPSQIGLVVQGCVVLRNEPYLEKLMEILTAPLANTTEQTLGDAYDHPSKDDLDRLTPLLLEKHGKLATSVYYCYIIHGEFEAAPLLEEYFAQGGVLAISFDDSPSVHLVRPISRSVDVDTRLRRRERREKRKRPLLPTPQPTFHKKRRIRKPALPREETPVAQSPIIRSPIQLVKAVHPHVDGTGGLSADDPLVGTVIQAFTHFEVGDPEVGGKVRPCVVIAVSSEFFLVRLIFSRPRRYAGHWRSVRLEDWKQAGLQHKSYASTQRRLIKRASSRVIGQLSTRDWNRICRGEVNSEGSL